MIAGGLLMGWLVAVAPVAGDGIDFEREIAPLLQARCVRCHDQRTTKGGLSLATLATAREGGESGPAIEPGVPDESLLLEKVTGEKPEMPRGGDPLKPEEVETLRRWIAGGAPWPEAVVLESPREEEGPWWAIQPLDAPPLPATRDRSWPRTPIDAFILAKLEEKGLAPRPEADRRTLIRRVTFDLTGLPPTPSEIDAFLHDPSPTAYENLVDRLLASPRYGERWARHWLDVAHYGDTHGYDKDKRREHAWPYRDYVIRAFNTDRPYGRFIEEQIAGDVLFPGDAQATIATGFVAAGPWDLVGHLELREGTVDKLKTRLNDRDDMLANTMSTFASLTVHCARCHDHKFDPISQRDYYRLQAVFAGVDRGDRPYDDPAALAEHQALAARRDAARERLDDVRRRIEAATDPEVLQLDRQAARLVKTIGEQPAPETEGPSPSNGYHSAIHAEPVAPAWVQVDLGASQPIDEVRLVPARPTDFPDTPGFGFPPAFKIEASDDPSFAAPTLIVEDRPAIPEALRDEPYVIRPKGVRARYIRVTALALWKRLEDYVFALGELEVISGNRNVAAGAQVSALDSIEAGRWSGGFLVDAHGSRARRPAADDPAARRRHDLLSEWDRLDREKRRLGEQRVDPALRSAEAEAVRELAASQERLEARPPTEPVYALVSHEPRPITVLRRGDVEQPGEPVGPGALSCVPGLEPDFADSPEEGPRRAALAHWLSDRRNPLTWRSIVNRVWHYHFGRGIVETPSDFGRNGASPSHPELLDWLAATFRDEGGSLKTLHRRIVTSAVYRQGSSHEETAAKIDAENRLLWRQNRRRLEAESVRDSVLFVAGRLDDRMGGPGFALFRFKDDHSPIYDHDDPAWIDPPAGRRRTVYRFIVRSVPNPFVECLDGADPNAMVPVRSTTLTALQALALLNDPFMIAEAAAMARRLEVEAGDDEGARIDRAFRLALGRPPAEAERAAVVAYARRHGLPNACRLILNLNEFLFID